MKMYLAFDIGCLECGEESAVIGVFNNKDDAEMACEAESEKQKQNWTGEHSFEVFEIEIK